MAVSWPPYLPDTNSFNHFWDIVGLYPYQAANVQQVTIDGNANNVQFSYGTANSATQTWDVLGYPASSSTAYLEVSGNTAANNVSNLDVTAAQTSVSFAGDNTTYSYQTHVKAQATLLTGIEQFAANFAQDLSSSLTNELQSIAND